MDNNLLKNLLINKFGISEKVYEFVLNSEKELKPFFDIDNKIKDFTQTKVLNSMIESKLSSIHFNNASGYGYGDIGRDKTEEIFAKLFDTEDALVRTGIVSGTHAIFLGLSALLKHGDTFMSISGPLYDTIQKAIGIKGNMQNTLLSRGIKYDEVDLVDNDFNKNTIIEKLNQINPKLVMIQRSTGYSKREAITIEKIEKVIKSIREVNKEVIIFVDNCYGELTQEREPSEVGADVICGSLIKNLGAGIALSGGYICGKTKYVQTCADFLTAPGLGKELGISYNTTRTTLQGLYYAPTAVCEAKKTSRLFAYCYNKLGYEVFPSFDAVKSDIVESIILKSEQAVVNFCKSIQSVSSVDSFVSPEPWDMPGYEDKVVMASGSFIDGSSIELSADGPIREPYIVYFQGGLSLAQGRIAVMKTIQSLLDSNIIDSNKLNN